MKGELAAGALVIETLLGLQLMQVAASRKVRLVSLELTSCVYYGLIPWLMAVL